MSSLRAPLRSSTTPRATSLLRILCAFGRREREGWPHLEDMPRVLAASLPAWRERAASDHRFARTLHALAPTVQRWCRQVGLEEPAWLTAAADERLCELRDSAATFAARG